MLALREDESAEPIAVGDRTPCDQRGNLRRSHRFEHAACSEVHGPAKIQPDDDRPVALIAKDLGVRLSGPGGDSPVHGSQIIARLIRTRLVVFHAAPLERRHVTARAYHADTHSGQIQRLASGLQPDQLG